MKTLLLILFSIIPLSFGQPFPDPVRDIDGNLLRSGTQYYILPALQGKGGGVALGPTRNETCPFDVVQTNQEIDTGLPVTFTPADPKKGVIRESIDIKIISSVVTMCTQSNIWMVEEYDGSQIVTAHGVEGNPGQGSNWFKIYKYEDGYKLMSCPTVCDVCRRLCGDIGIKIAENGSRRLAISDAPFKVVFKQA